MTVEGVIGYERVGERLSADSLPPLVIGRECGRPVLANFGAGESRRHFFLSTNTTWVGCIRSR